jgi:hypothetical protein
MAELHEQIEAVNRGDMKRPRTCGKLIKSSQPNYQKTIMSYYRSLEHRRLRAKLIHKWKPWEKSTGPRSQVSKVKVPRNAYQREDYVVPYEKFQPY